MLNFELNKDEATKLKDQLLSLIEHACKPEVERLPEEVLILGQLLSFFDNGRVRRL